MTGENSCDFSLDIWGLVLLKSETTYLYCSGETVHEAHSNLQRALDFTMHWFKEKKTSDKFFCRTQPV